MLLVVIPCERLGRLGLDGASRKVDTMLRGEILKLAEAWIEGK